MKVKAVDPNDILDRAIDVINETGWRKLHAGPISRNGTHCVLGAIYLAAHELGIPWSEEDAHLATVDRQMAIRALSQEVGTRTNWRTCDPVRWNDYLVHDADEIIDALKRAKEHL